MLRYAPANFNGSLHDIAGVRNEAGNVFGLMPHPEHAVDELISGSDRRAVDLRVDAPGRGGRACLRRDRACRRSSDALALGLTGAEYELVCEKQGRAPNQVELAMYSLLWSEHCAYKHSKKLLRTLPTEGAHVVMGPGENAGAVDVGRRPGVRLQGRVPQPPQRRRALPGRRHGGRRDPARHLRDRRASDRRARLAALRRARREWRPRALPARRRRRGDRALRQLDRRAHRRRRGLLRGALRAELPRQRDGARARAARAARAQRRRRARATCSCCSAPPPAATGSAAPRCSPRPSSATTRGDDKRPTVQVGRSVRGEEAAGVLARAARARAARLAAGPRRRRADLLGRRDGLQGRGRDRHRRRRACRCASPAWSPSRSWSASPRSACSASSSPATSRRCSRCASAGRSAARRSAPSPTPAGCASCAGEELVGDMPVRALVDDCPLYDLAAGAARRAALPARRADARARDAAPPRRCWRCSRSPNIASRRPLFEQYDSIVQSRTVRRPEQADAAVLALPDGGGARRQHRLQRPPRRRRPLPRHDRGGARVRRQPRLRRRRAARARPTTSTSATPRSRTSPGS